MTKRLSKTALIHDSSRERKGTNVAKIIAKIRAKISESCDQKLKSLSTPWGVAGGVAVPCSIIKSKRMRSCMGFNVP
jgi:hypothetical protein